MLIKFGFLVEETLWKMENNEERIYKVPFRILDYVYPLELLKKNF